MNHVTWSSRLNFFIIQVEELQYIYTTFLFKLCTSENRYCQEAVDSVTTVGSCPTTKAEWDAAARRKDCNRIASTQKCSDVDKFVYHCVINGYRNQTLEVCAPLRIIFGNYNFIYQTKNHSLVVYSLSEHFSITCMFYLIFWRL